MLATLKGDNLLLEEPQLDLPDFKYLSLHVNGALAKDEKLKINLVQAANAVKNDKVILSGLSEAILSEAKDGDDFWASAPRFVVDSSGFVMIILIANGVYLILRHRALALSSSSRANSEVALILSYSGSTISMPGSKANATDVEAFGRVIISVSNSVWPQALAILTAIILVL